MTRTMMLGMLALALLPSKAVGQTLEIVDRPILYDAERERLTLEYWRRHYGEPESSRITPRVVVIHWTAIRGLEASHRAFDRVRARRKKLRRQGEVNVSTHFLVGRKGEVWRLLPVDRMARHVIGLNHVAVGVDLVATGEEQITEAQLAATDALVRDLRSRHPTITHLIGHNEAHLMEPTSLYRELVDGYRNRKPDPGKRFMARLRARVGVLELSGPPRGKGGRPPRKLREERVH